MKICTIHHASNGDTIARDSEAPYPIIARRSHSGNPAAFHQLLGDVARADYAVDWEDSPVAKPDWADTIA